MVSGFDGLDGKRMRKNFVKDIRELRELEIQQYEAKGYRVANKAEYLLNDVIRIEMDQREYLFGIRVNINEVYFYIWQEGAQIYLTIYDIYLLLWKLVYSEYRIYLIDSLDFYMRNDETVDFFYKGGTYTVHRLPDLPEDNVELLNSDVSISIRELMLLIYLIQDKSNYFEGLSKGKAYVDGLVRLLKVLLECNAPNAGLETLGWIFNSDLGRFELRKEQLVGERNKKRYYLTVKEERLILKSKES